MRAPWRTTMLCPAARMEISLGIDRKGRQRRIDAPQVLSDDIRVVGRIDTRQIGFFAREFVLWRIRHHGTL